MTCTLASDIDIDHMVPLAEAWRSGIYEWDSKMDSEQTKKRRAEYASDPLVLVSVKDTANQSKGDSDPSEWRPWLKESWCNYAKRWIAIKDKYELTVDCAEKISLHDMLDTCGK
jgi:hypothetical protein